MQVFSTNSARGFGFVDPKQLHEPEDSGYTTLIHLVLLSSLEHEIHPIFDKNMNKNACRGKILY